MDFAEHLFRAIWHDLPDWQLGSLLTGNAPTVIHMTINDIVYEPLVRSDHLPKIE